jgi:hypothetical protein
VPTTAACRWRAACTRGWEASTDLGAVAIRDLIETSLGNPSALALTQKSTLIDLATSFGIRCPETKAIRDLDAAAAALSHRAYPAVLKADGMFGGKGVRIVRGKEEGLAAFRELKLPARWPQSAKRAVMAMSLSPLDAYFHARGPAVTLQDYVAGRPANRAVVCWKGKVLAGISAEAIEVAHETGPSTVVRIIESAEMDAAAELLVQKLGMSGFCGFDFVIDAEQRAWLIETNPRITPVVHLRRNADLIGALYQHLTGVPARPRPALTTAKVALFPHEWLRNPASDHLLSSYHDVPWDHADLVRCCVAFRKSRKAPSIWSRMKPFRRTTSEPARPPAFSGGPGVAAATSNETVQ